MEEQERLNIIKAEVMLEIQERELRFRKELFLAKTKKDKLKLFAEYLEELNKLPEF